MISRMLGGLCLVMVCSALFAQVPSAPQTQGQTGTVEGLDQDNGALTISGQRLPFSDAVTQVYLDGRRIGAEKIDLGMVVRYTLDAAGTLLRVELIGPNDKLMELQNH